MIGRFGKGSDHLLIGDQDDDAHGSTAPSHLRILTFDAVRGGYWIYDPSFYNDLADPARGHDEPVDIVIHPPATMIWKRTIRGNQRQTIQVSGDHWDEKVESTFRNGDKRVVETRLTKRADKTVWGVPAGP